MKYCPNKGPGSRHIRDLKNAKNRARAMKKFLLEIH
jgi:hypothetical protein